MRGFDRHDDAEMADLWVYYHVIDAVDGCVGHVIGLQSLDPVRQRLAHETRVEFQTQCLILGDAALARVEARITRKLRCAERRDQSLPELLERRQVNRYQPLVCCTQDVGLRQPGPVGGGGSLSECEERGEGLDGEVRHRFQHGYFDVTATRGAAPLHQGREDAL